MSLLRDALRARKEKEKPDPAVPVVFQGPVIDADEILGGDSRATDGHDVDEGYSEPANPAVVNDSLLLKQNADVIVDDRALPSDTIEFSLQADEDPVVPQQEPIQQPVSVSEDDDVTLQQQTEHTAPADPAISEKPRQHASAHQKSRGLQPDPAMSSQTVAEPMSASPEYRATTAMVARSMNLDPLFFIIIAFAFAGLFGSLYALVTQNDEFVSREYSELRARQAALDEFARDNLIDVEQGQNEPGRATKDAALTAVAESGLNQISQSAVSAIDTDKAAGSDNSKATDVAIPASEFDGNIDGIETEQSKTVVDTTMSRDTVNAKNQQSIDGDERKIALLQNELQDLRQSLASQNLRISKFIDENTALRRAQVASSKSVSANSDKSGDVTIVEEAKTGLNDFYLENSNTGSSVTANVNSEPFDRPTQIRGYIFQSSDASGSDLQTSGADAASIQVASRRTNNSVKTNRHLESFPAVVGQAFHAYSTGNLNQAGALYARALQLDPYNRDANLGVAAVAVKTGNYPVAIQRYRHLLSLQPDDAVAFSAMLNLIAVTRNASIENEMIAHTKQNRQIPSLHAALGNFYSQTARWRQASQSYAAAVGLAPDTADYLYNLAVSLDNLGDSQAAIETYDRALSLSDVSAYTFSVVEASARLRALQAN